MYSKTCVKRTLSKDQKLVSKTNYRLMQVNAAFHHGFHGFQDKNDHQGLKRTSSRETLTLFHNVIKCACQSVHPHSLISAFVIHLLQSMMNQIATHTKASAVSLTFTWSETPKFRKNAQILYYLTFRLL